MKLHNNFNAPLFFYDLQYKALIGLNFKVVDLPLCGGWGRNPHLCKKEYLSTLTCAKGGSTTLSRFNVKVGGNS